jgi:hypothetical protein
MSFAENMGKNLKDAVSIKLDCGHPNIESGKQCPLCGQTVPVQEITNEEQENKQEGSS